MEQPIAYYHLPGLFEFTELYRLFFHLREEHPAYCYPWCTIGSVYGAPAGSLWGGGRVGFGEDDVESTLALLRQYGISARLTFSNSLLQEEHLNDPTCNALLQKLADEMGKENGVIVHSDLLAGYIAAKYPSLYLVSSTTKVLTEQEELLQELSRPEFRYVVPDFRLNRALAFFESLPTAQKEKVELLCNECCSFTCHQRRACYETISKKSLGLPCKEHHCTAPHAQEGYRFSRAMENPGFISMEAIQNTFLPMGIRHFKLEGRGLGSAVVLEMLLYYMVKPEYHLKVREAIYLDAMLDLF